MRASDRLGLILRARGDLHHLERYWHPDGPPIELHYGLTIPSHLPDIDLDRLWHRAHPARICGAEDMVLSPEDTLLHLCIHAAFHHLFGLKLLSLATSRCCSNTVRNGSMIRSNHLARAHTDLGGGNVVVDPAGRLHVVDNEHFRIGPPGMDLARTWYRWGLYRRGSDTAEWQRFRHAYAGVGGAAGAFTHEPFWRIAAVAVSARLRPRTVDPTIAAPIQCLIRLAGSVSLPKSRKP